MKEEDLFGRAWDKWGVSLQLDMICEEAAELIQKTVHVKRGRIGFRDLVEEIVDVQIMCDQYLHCLRLGRVAGAMRLRKLDRLRKRLEEEGSE